MHYAALESDVQTVAFLVEAGVMHEEVLLAISRPAHPCSTSVPTSLRRGMLVSNRFTGQLASATVCREKHITLQTQLAPSSSL